MPIFFIHLGCCHSLEENISNTIFEELIVNMFTSLGNMLFAFILIPATLTLTRRVSRNRDTRDPYP